MTFCMKICMHCEMLPLNNSVWQQQVLSTNLQYAGWSYKMCGSVLHSNHWGSTTVESAFLMVHPQQEYLLTLLLNTVKKFCW